MIEVALGHANKPKPEKCLSPLFFWHRGKQENDEAKTVETISFFDIQNFQKLSDDERDIAVLKRIEVSNEMISLNDFKLCLDNRLRNSLKAMIMKFPNEFDKFSSQQSEVLLSSLDCYTFPNIASVYKVEKIIANLQVLGSTY